MVTPKEVDVFIEDMANLIANGLNAALHESINQDNTGTIRVNLSCPCLSFTQLNEPVELLLCRKMVFYPL